VLDPGDILHVPSLGFDGLRSPSPITYAAREAIGTSIAAEEYTARFFSQGSTHDIALKTRRSSTPSRSKVLRELPRAARRRRECAHPAHPHRRPRGREALDHAAGCVARPTRQFTVEELCRVLGVPPFMVGRP
jgi:hypothetical protein